MLQRKKLTIQNEDCSIIDNPHQAKRAARLLLGDDVLNTGLLPSNGRPSKLGRGTLPAFTDASVGLLLEQLEEFALLSAPLVSERGRARDNMIYRYTWNTTSKANCKISNSDARDITGERINSDHEHMWPQKTGVYRLNYLVLDPLGGLARHILPPLSPSQPVIAENKISCLGKEPSRGSLPSLLSL